MRELSVASIGLLCLLTPNADEGVRQIYPLVRDSSRPSCSPRRTQYQSQNERWLVRNVEDEKKYLKLDLAKETEKTAAALTDAVVETLDREALVSSASLVAEINCLQQSPEYDNWNAFSNAPQAYRVKLSGHSAVVLAFWIYRGYSATPDMHPFIVVLNQETGGWYSGQEVDDVLVGHTFHVSLLNTSDATVTLLVYGNRIGDTATRLEAEVIRFDGKKVEELWQRKELPYASVTLEGTSGFRIDHPATNGDRSSKASEHYRFDGGKLKAFPSSSRGL